MRTHGLLSFRPKLQFQNKPTTCSVGHAGTFTQETKLQQFICLPGDWQSSILAYATKDRNVNLVSVKNVKKITAQHSELLAK